MINEGDDWAERVGGCLCGAVRYRVDGPPLFVLACHCSDCQVRSGGAFSMSMPVLEASFQVLQGTPVVRSSQHDTRDKCSYFCGDCHTRIWLTGSATPGVLTIKAGTLDRRDDLNPVAHQWLRSRQPWVRIPDDALRYETQPPDFEPVVRAWAARSQPA